MRADGPVMLYDGECGFCRLWIERWRRETGDRVRYLPYQSPGLLRRYGIAPWQARAAVQLIESDGRRTQGAPAVFRALGRSPSRWIRALARLGLLPGVRLAAQTGYRWIATHRKLASHLTRRLLPAPRRPRASAAGQSPSSLTRRLSPLGVLSLLGLAFALPLLGRHLWRRRRARRPAQDRYRSGVDPTTPG
jgi:predicted DCC family thiol-disulfide oxidoreductase YuxK